MTLDQARKEVASMMEEGTGTEKIEKIALIYLKHISDYEENMSAEEWESKGAAIKSDVLHELLLTH